MIQKAVWDASNKPMPCFTSRLNRRWGYPLQVLDTLWSKDPEVVQSVMCCIEQLYHLCPAYQKAVLVALLARGHLEKLNQIVQGFMALTLPSGAYRGG